MPSLPAMAMAFLVALLLTNIDLYISPVAHLLPCQKHIRDIEARNAKSWVGQGWTPLHYAVDDGDAFCVRELIIAGFDVNAADDKGETPLMLAALNTDVFIGRQLLDAGADALLVSKRQRNALYFAGFPILPFPGGAEKRASFISMLESSMKTAAFYRFFPRVRVFGLDRYIFRFIFHFFLFFAVSVPVVVLGSAVIEYAIFLASDVGTAIAASDKSRMTSAPLRTNTEAKPAAAARTARSASPRRHSASAKRPRK